ncbi:TPA-induced transmembrane protein [Rhinatrema bivittatum]|uniref:TPA-induced transmembrane protein n=1 Tax=Rhinatrema bivittatum TaxID=194408 RepID=UPI00112B1441|nr:TPA-induced transmembrane protein [Rhinatrema bivittatum]
MVEGQEENIELEENGRRAETEIVIREPLLIPATAPTEQKMKCRDSCRERVFWKCRLWMVIASVFAFIIIITIVSLVLYSAVYIDEDETFYLDSPLSKNYTGTIRVINKCIPTAMHLSAPEETNLLSDQIIKRITDVYKSSPALGHYFVSARVISFSNENATASYTLQFSVPDEDNFLKYTMSEEFLSGVLQQDIHDQEESECKLEVLDASPLSLSSL